MNFQVPVWEVSSYLAPMIKKGEVIEIKRENNTITASVAHFTTFAIIGRVPAPAPPEEEVVVPPEEEVVVPPE
ncbi:unnamed protein product, partial [marine sediment metagenome]